MKLHASLAASSLLALGIFGWSAVARADATPGCGGDGQAVCKAKPARSHGKAKSVGCPSGAFFDPRAGGECWTCKGKVRTIHAVTSASACGRDIFDGRGGRATFVRTVWGCNEGQFFDLVDRGSCWSCPEGTTRGVGHVKSATACSVLPWQVCDPGMERDGDRCRPNPETKARAEANAAVARHASELSRAIALTLGLADDSGLGDMLGAKDQAAQGRVLASPAFRDAPSPSPKPVFNTITVGAATSATLIGVSGNAETGIAIDRKGSRPIYWYGSSGYKFGPGLGADAGISVGIWKAENHQLGGDSQGVVLGLSDLAQLGSTLAEGLDFKPGASVAIAVWFSYPDEHGEIELQGFTVTPAVSAGVDLGGYVKATTFQIE